MSNELEQRALDNAADDHDRRHTPTPTPQVVETVEDWQDILAEALKTHVAHRIRESDGGEYIAVDDVLPIVFGELSRYPHPAPDVLADIEVLVASHARELLEGIPISKADPDWDPNDEFLRCAIDRYRSADQLVKDVKMLLLTGSSKSRLREVSDWCNKQDKSESFGESRHRYKLTAEVRALLNPEHTQ